MNLEADVQYPDYHTSATVGFATSVAPLHQFRTYVQARLSLSPILQLPNAGRSYTGSFSSIVAVLLFCVVEPHSIPYLRSLHLVFTFLHIALEQHGRVRTKAYIQNALQTASSTIGCQPSRIFYG